MHTNISYDSAATLIMKAIKFSEMLVHLYHKALCHIPNSVAPQSPSQVLQMSQNKHLNLKDECVFHEDRLSKT